MTCQMTLKSNVRVNANSSFIFFIYFFLIKKKMSGKFVNLSQGVIGNQFSVASQLDNHEQNMTFIIVFFL